MVAAKAWSESEEGREHGSHGWGRVKLNWWLKPVGSMYSSGGVWTQLAMRLYCGEDWRGGGGKRLWASGLGVMGGDWRCPLRVVTGGWWCWAMVWRDMGEGVDGKDCVRLLAANCEGVRISGTVDELMRIAQGIRVRRACLIFEIRKRSCADCSILEVARECFTGISERRARAQRWRGFGKSNPATPWLIVQEVEWEVLLEAAMQQTSLAENRSVVARNADSVMDGTVDVHDEEEGGEEEDEDRAKSWRLEFPAALE